MSLCLNIKIMHHHDHCIPENVSAIQSMIGKASS